jgi:glycosyl transferase family 87
VLAWLRVFPSSVSRASRAGCSGPSPRLLFVVFGCLVLSVGARWLLDGLYQFASIDWKNAWHYDAGVDWSAAQLFWRGISPYSREGLKFVGVGNKGFGHPPTTPFWFLPLAQFDEPTMAHIIGLLNFAMLLALVAIVVFTLRFPLPSISTLAIFGYLQASPTTSDHNELVQLSVAIAFGTVIAWKWLREAKDWRGGAALGLACTLKPFPWVLLPLLFLMRRFRAFVAAGAAFSIVAAIMTWRFGLDAWFLFVEQQKRIAGYWMGSARNASLQGVLRRALKDRCARRWQLDEQSLKLLTLGACGLLLVGCIWISLRALRRRPERATFDLVYALLCVVGVFINPFTWEHYVFLLVMPLLVAAHAIGSRFLLSFEAWSQGKTSHLRQLGATGLACAACVPLIQIPHWTDVTLHVNRLAKEQYCGYRGDPSIHAWLLRRAEYFDLTSWLPWAVTIIVLAALLLFPRGQGALEPGVPATGRP